MLRRQQSYFKKGHKNWRKANNNSSQKMDNSSQEMDIVEEVSWKSRLTRQMFQKVVTTRADGVLLTVDADNRPGKTNLLRPKSSAETSLSESYLEKGRNINPGENEMRLVSKTLNVKMWNECITHHSEQSKDCRVPQFEIDRELKKGICWKQGLKCINCGFKSRLYKLYEEIATVGRGAKTASPNVGLQVGLQESMCGNYKARIILASTNTPPPSRSSMQTMANKVGAITATMTSDDLKNRREGCKEINRLRGLSPGSPINIGIDCRYNSQTISGRHKMGQNASQAIGVAIEHQTDERAIIALDVRNQLCSGGKRLKRNGAQLTCPGGHPGCTANTMVNEPLSEYTIGEEIGHMFARQGVLVRHVTTDGDGRSADGVAAAMAKVDPSCVVIRQADTTHLGQGQFRHTQRTKFSPKMFPGLKALDRKRQRKNFGLDVKSRCYIVYNALHRHFAGDLGKISMRLPKTVEALLDCYAGDCSHCRRNFTACSGGKREGWWTKSVYLKPARINKLNMSANDRKLLKAVIEMKLSEESVQLQKFNFNTDKNEAVNRGISASLPKNVKFSRNVLGRASAAVDRLNYGLGDSMLRKLEAVGCPISKGGHVAKAVRGFQNQCHYHRLYQKRKDVLRRNIIQRAQAIREYYRTQLERVKAGTKVRALYRKGQIDPKPIIKKIIKKIPPSKATKPNIAKEDHNYCKLTDKTWDHSYSNLSKNS